MNEPRDITSGDDPCDRAVAAVLAEPVPCEALERTMDAALRWETTAAPMSHPNYRRRAAWLAFAATLTVTAAAIAVVLTPARSPDDSGSAQPAGVVTFFEPGPATAPIVADSAPIIVMIGPARPVTLGEEVSHQEIHRGAADDRIPVHVWDWSQSDRSRVIVAPGMQLGSLSPDGTKTLNSAGTELDLATGNTRRLFDGFALQGEERVLNTWFSPSGRYLAALIHLRTEVQRVQLYPPLYGNTPWFSLRVVEPATGRIVVDVPADSVQGAFSPDERWICYASPENRIVRQDLRTGQMLTRYEPSLEPHGAVGIAVSPDGAQVAAGHYHGELFLWETESGRQVLHHLFLRDNGERDGFFQAKLIKFSPDGKWLAMASNSRLKVLDTRTGTIVTSHYHETTPAFVHLRWSPDARTITLVSASTIGQFAAGSGFPPRVTSDILPRVYEWDWQAGELEVKVFAAGE
jgi:WD40 repeat protein